MKRQVTLPAPNVSRRLASVASVTRAWNSGKRSQVIAVSNVSENTPMATNVSRR